MGYLLIKWDDDQRYHDFVKRLEGLPGISFHGDYYQNRIDRALELGIAIESHAMQCLVDVKSKIEIAYAVCLELENGSILKGAIRPEGLLVGWPKPTPGLSLEESRVRNLLNVAHELWNNVTCEVHAG